MNILGKRMTAAVLAAMIMITGICRLSIPVQAATGEYKSWLQTDSRWGSIQLGSSGATMSRIGCAVTSLAKLVYIPVLQRRKPLTRVSCATI